MEVITEDELLFIIRNESRAAGSVYALGNMIGYEKGDGMHATVNGKRKIFPALAEKFGYKPVRMWVKIEN